MNETEKELAHKLELRQRAPFWWPDIQSLIQLFLTVSIVLMVAFILKQLFNGGEVKIDPSARDLVMVIIGIILGAFKDVFGFSFGNSAGEKAKGEAINRSIETKDKFIAASSQRLLTPSPDETKVVVSWWSLFTESEKLAVESAALKDDNIKAILGKFKIGKAEPADLATLVAKGLFKEERSMLLQTANTEVT